MRCHSDGRCRDIGYAEFECFTCNCGWHRLGAVGTWFVSAFVGTLRAATGMRVPVDGRIRDFEMVMAYAGHCRGRVVS
ncbi:MAG: hypothetical protein NTZ17_04290 [Phycisphaerae bacterium]|nr:hypothetical protein [Phycisphaerae bacterium]